MLGPRFICSIALFLFFPAHASIAKELKVLIPAETNSENDNSGKDLKKAVRNIVAVAGKYDFFAVMCTIQTMDVSFFAAKRPLLYNSFVIDRQTPFLHRTWRTAPGFLLEKTL